MVVTWWILAFGAQCHSVILFHDIYRVTVST